jgi:hypothetical protein
MSYYEDRDENFIVGIIDNNPNKESDEIDIFKIREPLVKTKSNKRGSGIPTLKGAVCATAKSKEYLMKIIKKIPYIENVEINRIDKLTRDDICNEIKNKFYF